jgi:hypothetical protein
MDSKFSSRRKKGSSKPIVKVLFAVLAIAAIIMGYLYWSDSNNLSETDLVRESDQVAVGVPGNDQVTVSEPIISSSQRVDNPERFLERMNTQSQSAIDAALKSEAILLALATRRRVERGQDLGQLDKQLRSRFEQNWPEEVETVVNFSKDPVTFDNLVLGLEMIDQGQKETIGVGLWTKLAEQFQELFVQRSSGLEQVRILLENKNLELAIIEVRQLVNTVSAKDWLTDAERYLEAMEALDRIENAALGVAISSEQDSVSVAE